jgi:hypothetical protein
LLSAAADERPAVPADVWDYGRHFTWHAELWKLIGDFAGEDVRKAFRRKRPKYVVSDDLSWLDSIVEATLHREVDTKAETTARLRQRYKAIRAYHGTSAADPSGFYEQGLRPLVPEEFHEVAKRLFLSGDFPELTDANLTSAIEEVGSKLRAGRVYFEANEWLLREQCGHYLLYGSEYLVAIAAHLGGSRDYRQVLKRQGMPTLLICDVPLRMVHDGTLSDLAGCALESLFQSLIDGPKYVPDKFRGAGFPIRERLDPSCIVGHCHPEISRDPVARWP